MWRKTSMRGYVPWMPAVIAGWEATVASMAAFYAATHVHLVHEGASTTTPQQYSGVGTGASDLMTASDFTQLVDEKVGVPAGPFNGKTAAYTTGYIWPYLDQNHWGIAGQAVDLNTFVDSLGSIEDKSWDLYSMFLVHKLIEGAERKLGHMRGHTIAEFKSSPPLICIEYACNVDKTHKFTEVANNPAGGESHTVGSQSVTFSRLPSNTNCKVAGCTGKYKFASSHQDEDGLPLCAIGQPIGGCWQYIPRYAETWAHEVGHHRHLQHAPSRGGSTSIAPGGKAEQHDSAANAFQAHEDSTHSRGWDRWCLMSYDKKAPRHFCGKCVLKNRGWAVNTLTNPAGDVQDA
jgi:hypothetical protein